MKKHILIIFLLIVLLLFACTNISKPKTISDNAVIKLKTYGGFIGPAYAVQELTITKTKAVYQIINKNGSLTKEYDREINESTHQSLIQLFRDVNFLQLNDTYLSATPVFDIGIIEISLIQADINKTVKIEPLVKNIPEGLLNITAALDELGAYVQESLVDLKFQPMQCEQTPWEKWYAEGNIKFIKEPTEKQLVVAYYGNKYGIEILDFQRIESGLGACEACSVCPTSYYFTVNVKNSDTEKMREEGWTVN